MNKARALVFSVLLLATYFSLYPASALDAPTNVTVTGNRGGAYAEGSVTVSWTAVADADNGYAIQTLLNGTQVGNLTGALGQKTTSIVISGLQGGSTYGFKVRAVSSSAVSTWTTAVNGMPITSPSTPAKPTHSTSGLDATVRWSAPISDGGAGITSYVVTEANTGRTQTVNATTFSAQFTGFASGSKVKFNVRAMNGVTAEGTTSANSDETTLPNVPNQVTGVTVSKTTVKDQLRVSWEIPGNGGSVLTGFQVFLRQGGVDIQNTEVTDIEATSAVFNGLAAGTYSAQVIAKNVIGSGARSLEPLGVDVEGIAPAVAASRSGGGSSGGGGGSSGGGTVATTPSPTPTPTASPSPTPTPTASPTPTPTPTPSSTATPTPVATKSSTATPKPLPTKASSPTPKPTSSAQKSPTTKVSSKPESSQTRSGSMPLNSSTQPVPINKPVTTTVPLPKRIETKGATARVLDSRGRALTGVKVSISNKGTLSAVFPKGTKSGTYQVKVTTKNKQTITLKVTVSNKK